MSRRRYGRAPQADWIAYQPNAELMKASVVVTRRMQRLAMPTATKTPVKRMESPGRLITRNAVQAAGLRAGGNPMAAMKVPLFRGHHVDRALQPPGVIGIMADISGSMKWSTTGVGEAAWLLARGAAHAGARVASVVFGEKVSPVVFPGEVPQTVLVRSANDWGHNPDRALAALDGALGLSRPSTTAGIPTSRVVVILSDMMWGEERKAFIVRARMLMATGVRFIVIGIPTDGQNYSTGRITPRLEDDIAVALGVHVPVDPRMTVEGSAQQQLLPLAEQRAIRQHGLAAFVGREPRAMTAEEARQVHMAGMKRLPAMTVIPRTLLDGDPNLRYYDDPSPITVRNQIVDHTLRVLEGME
jgi:hypothetical protein